MQKGSTRVFKLPLFLTLGLVLTLAILAGPLVSFTTGLTARAGNNCTYTQGYWKNHPSTWSIGLTLGNTFYTQQQLLDILNSSPKGDATYILAHQLIGAKLNLADGADPSALGTTIADADAWLAANPLGSSPSGAAASVGKDLATTLASFNTGAIGPGHCGSDTPPPSICYDYNGSPATCPGV